MARPDDRLPVITIVGLGPMGRALGAELQRVKSRYEILGHDRDADNVKAAKIAGAVDRTNWNLVSVAEEADLLIITEPLQEALATLADVAPHLKPASVVTDTAPAKVAMMARAAEVLPDHVSFVGGHPIVAVPSEGSPEAGLFEGREYCLVPAAAASPEAVQVVTRVVSALGAKPYFIDAAEHDALTLGVGPVPYLFSAALMRMVGTSPSIRDLRRLAGDRLASVTDDGQDREAYRQLIGTGGDAVVPWLDGLVAQLGRVRDAVAAGDSSELAAFFREVDDATERWSGAVLAETAERSAAFEELKDRNLVADTLFGRLGRRRPPAEGD